MNNEEEIKFTIGTDIEEIDRFRALEDESPFYARVFSPNELAYCRRFQDPSPHFATTFAGKEAVVKATSSTCRVALSKVEILRDEQGAPLVVLHEECDYDLYVSLSHSASHAVAVALAVRQSYASDMNEIRQLLVSTVKQILPGGEVP